ncbi:MAG: 50S ribosomal protein L22 [Leptospiraceae bacterium]|jgi:large subunit ribosomal protein L22|nr:50S ribosomal protein L22 [Leptospiraceae bacterium]MBK7058694.1 50S ribosomal protein L22 [Leptospiraceae bacterium]MBK8395809.1 50S ribosomal protein L22 [Leptospiraceae bacterium]MBK9498462.1 50S ribosomal protein L22 [Leptospiraceae bacterium]MBL0264859.1 50S ribosomal protein L22 [Leptospiraceae bacterium]
MEAKAVAKYVRVSARKARLVANEVRGYDYTEAVDILKFTQKRVADEILNVVNSAAANAVVADAKIDLTKVYIKKIYVEDGPIMKRFKARARGRASRIRKRLSHITVVLSN